MNIYKLHNMSGLGHATAVTIGMFDGVHIGHQHILEQLKREAESQNLTPVVVTFDLHPRQVLGTTVGGTLDSHFRVSTNEERYQLLQRYGINDVVEVHFTPEMAALSACEFFEQVLLQQLGVRVLVLGFDNVFGSKQRNDFDQLPALAERHGVRVVQDTAVSLGNVRVSSTQIRQAVSRGDVLLAGAMLGHDYRLWGIVAEGRKTGRKLGYPTANVSLDDNQKVIPAEGVYAVNVRMDNVPVSLPAMANLGGQPTFGLDKPVLEVHVFGFEGDLYGRTMHVEFVDRLRDVMCFENLDQLVKQLELDKQHALQLLKKN